MDCKNYNINTIQEIYKGVYRVLLDFPTKDILYSLVDKTYKYIWCINYIENPYEWKNNINNLYGIEKHNVLSRNLRMEYIIRTEDFIDLIPSIKGSLHIIQTNSIPPYYLDINKLADKPKYKLLNDNINFLFEIDLPASPDYTELISPNKIFLENIISKY